MAIVLSILKCNSRTIGPSPRGWGRTRRSRLAPPPSKKSATTLLIVHRWCCHAKHALTGSDGQCALCLFTHPVLLELSLPTADCFSCVPQWRNVAGHWPNCTQRVQNRTSKQPQTATFTPDISQARTRLIQVVLKLSLLVPNFMPQLISKREKCRPKFKVFIFSVLLPSAAGFCPQNGPLFGLTIGPHCKAGENLGLKTVFRFFCTKAEHESTTQKHMKNILHTVRRSLLKTNHNKNFNVIWGLFIKLYTIKIFKNQNWAFGGFKDFFKNLVLQPCHTDGHVTPIRSRTRLWWTQTLRDREWNGKEQPINSEDERL